MDLEPSSKAQDYLQRLSAFMDAEVYPAEAVYEQQMTEQAAAGRVTSHLRSSSTSNPALRTRVCGTSSCRTNRDSRSPSTRRWPR